MFGESILYEQLACAAQRSMLCNCTQAERAIVAQAAVIMHDAVLAKSLLAQHSAELRVITRAQLQQIVDAAA
jgi:hypothetical protein